MIREIIQKKCINDELKKNIISLFLQEKNNRWSEAVFTITTRRTEILPIVDVQLNDIGLENQEFGIKVDDVCFKDDGYLGDN